MINISLPELLVSIIQYPPIGIVALGVLSELEDDSPYMAIEALSLNDRTKFIDDFKNMVYTYYNSFKVKNDNTRVLKR